MTLRCKNPGKISTDVVSKSVSDELTFTLGQVRAVCHEECFFDKGTCTQKVLMHNCSCDGEGVV